MRPSFAIDSFPARAALYRATHAIVAVDVFRASTTIVTALACGRRVYTTSSVGEALRIASSLGGAWLAGEQAGVQPEGFDLQNSPSAVERLPDRRPLVLVSSAGVLLLAMANGAPAVYAACLRNLTATARCLAERHHRVAVIGAGNRGEARAEDQMACAWLGRLLVEAGFAPDDASTLHEVERWTDADPMTLLSGPSAEYLRSTGQEEDIAFVLGHLDDVTTAAEYDGVEVHAVAGERDATEPPGEAA